MSADIGEMIVRIPVLLFAITIHEFAHGYAAMRLGDPTAKLQGRLSLNPLPHIDPIGAICLFLFNFGWAKPVPINPRYFKDIRKGIIITAIAGPLANLLTAFIAGMLIRSFFPPIKIYQMVMIYLLLMNLGLGLFNLLPIPPLDGSNILENILPYEMARKFGEFKRYGAIILISIVMLDNFAHTGILSKILIKPIFYLAYLFSDLPMLRQ
ncbi:MAG: site-2 protease family protein [Desulfobacterales bacterium]|jgi:Zn-dependent protease|nr:site-2 protease family protein [Desulfobacteraceae bacterium]MBT4365639.1 site-2 protease family protein [Desulfobacteraceae bacterium]MBT7086046.1 site-2 protease family protein [Desulfobacterales bacterium]MBT7697327.1 site-2 protease family protein [Desulfobacterales bacterium]